MNLALWLLSWVYQWLFGCQHNNYSWPQTVRFGPEKGTHVACLDCGKRLEYDFGRMRVVSSWESYRSEQERIYKEA